MAEADPVVGGVRFRTIGELAERCGHYCWLESSLFALLGDRASRAGGPEERAVAPEVRVALSDMASHHALLAAQWRDRLPVRAGVDAEALIAPPPGPMTAAVDLLAAQFDPVLVLDGVAESLLPRLLDAYAAHLAQASPVSEAPVRAVLEYAVWATRRQVGHARSLLQRAVQGAAPAGDGTGKRAEFAAALERALEGGKDVFPAARAS